MRTTASSSLLNPREVSASEVVASNIPAVSNRMSLVIDRVIESVTVTDSF